MFWISQVALKTGLGTTQPALPLCLPPRARYHNEYSTSALCLLGMQAVAAVDEVKSTVETVIMAATPVQTVICEQTLTQFALAAGPGPRTCQPVSMLSQTQYVLHMLCSHCE